MTSIYDRYEISIHGVACDLFVSITPSHEEGLDHNIMASICIQDVPEVLLATATDFDAMHIPDGSIQDELDRQVALASAEALLDTDKLQRKAAETLAKLETMYRNHFGV